MIKRLRIRLIFATMAVLVIVLLAIIGIASILNYQKTIRQADSKIILLSENDGFFPEDIPKGGHGFSPEMPFESRYFSVILNDNGEVITVNTGRIASVNEEAATEYAKLVMQKNKTKGFIDTYRYLICFDDSGNTIIYFLSCHGELESIHSFILNSILVSFIGVIIVMILVVIVSRRITKPISESYEKQKMFITDAGHELKTPLTIISADTEVLEMDIGENEWTNDIRNQTERLAELTNNLVFLARMEEQPKQDKIEFSISDVVNEAIDDYETVAKMKKKNMSSYVEENLTMTGDEGNIRRLIAIFLDNAIKYTNDNGDIQIKLDKYRGNIRLKVFNTTNEIDKEAINHLFDRFYRTDKSRNSKMGGYGLGLSIASAIVSSHNGKITASSEDEKSLLITVIFPR